METIRAQYEKALYESDSFSVFLYRPEKGGSAFRCAGAGLPKGKGVTYAMEGEFIEDKKYGKQFKISSYEECIEETKSGIISYLSSGIIKGIGKQTAKKIYDKFGDKSIRVIAEAPEELLAIKGITQEKMLAIADAYAENHIPKSLVELLLPCNMPPRIISYINKRYKNTAVYSIKSNPYDLCKIKGISFAMADKLRISLEISETDPRRIHAAIKEALWQSFFSGNVGTTKDQLLSLTSKTLDLKNLQVIWNEVIAMAKTGHIKYTKKYYDGKLLQFFYLKEVKDAEESLAEYIKEGLTANVPDESDKAGKLIDTVGDMIVLDDTQKRAVLEAFKHPITIITGGPGVGKTTIIKKIATIDKKIAKNREQILLAPTGKAARRITESTGIPASTVHSRLHIRPKDEGDEYYTQEDVEDIKNALVVIDEFSMVDMMLALLIFKHTKNCRIVVVGDPDQLQSVGAGNVLKDMINSKVIPCTKLSYVHRQDNGSMINKNAHAIQNGQEYLEEAADFKCIYDNAPSEGMMSRIEEKMLAEYLKVISSMDMNSVVCLCPYKKGPAGVYSVNNRLQALLNPPDGRAEFKGKDEYVFRVGDPVMHVKTNTEDASNGNVGVVIKVGKEDDEPYAIAEYDLGDRHSTVKYTGKTSDQLALAYAITVHKAQGSEYDAVISCLTRNHSMMLRRNILYTAMTRARKKVVYFFDSQETVTQTIKNNKVDERNTRLNYLLKEEVASDTKKAENPLKEKIEKSTQIPGQMSLFTGPAAPTETLSEVPA